MSHYYVIDTVSSVDGHVQQPEQEQCADRQDGLKTLSKVNREGQRTEGDSPALAAQGKRARLGKDSERVPNV